MPARAVVAAIDMGYGHLRPAAALAGFLGAEVLHLDRPPLGSETDARFWESTRELYEPLTRFSQLPGIGGPLRALLNTITAIPSPWPARDLSGPTRGRSGSCGRRATGWASGSPNTCERRARRS